MPISNLKTNFNLDSANPTYQGERNYLLKVAENNPLRLHPNDPEYLKPHLDSKDRLAIGYGYDLEKNKSNIVADFAQIGITLNQHAIDIISDLTGPTTAANRDKLSQYLVLPNETTATSLLEIAANARELTFQTFLDTNGISLGQSCERAALMSMWYQTAAYFRIKGDDNNPTSLGTALVSGNRAEAWYEIRYASSANGANGLGVVGRRFVESEKFGLYNDPTKVDDDEAKQVLQMYARHQDKITDYETKYSAQIVQANDKDYKLVGADRVDTLEEAR